MRLVVVCGLSDHKLWSKIAPLTALPGVEEVAVVRREPLDEPGVRNYCPPSWLRRIVPLAEVYRFLTLLWLCCRPPRPDRIIAIYLIPHGVYAGLVGWLLQIKVIQLLIGSDLNPALANRLLFSIVRHAHRVGVRGEHSVKRLVARGILPASIFVPPNVFDVEAYAPDSSTESDYDVIYVGSLINCKGLDILLQVIARLRSHRPNVRVALVGSGPLRNTLEALAVKLGIDNNVSFLGALRPAEIPCYLNKARLFVMTSKVEGLPMAMVEALSCGVPVIVSPVDDVTAVAHHGENAWVVSPPTVDNFTEAISTLLEDADLYARLRQGALRSREAFRTQYSLAAAADIWARALGIEGNR